MATRPVAVKQDDRDFILEAVALTCESAWKILPQYRCVSIQNPLG